MFFGSICFQFVESSVTIKKLKQNAWTRVGGNHPSWQIIPGLGYVVRIAPIYFSHGVRGHLEGVVKQPDPWGTYCPSLLTTYCVGWSSRYPQKKITNRYPNNSPYLKPKIPILRGSLKKPKLPQILRVLWHFNQGEKKILGEKLALGKQSTVIKANSKK